MGGYKWCKGFSIIESMIVLSISAGLLFFWLPAMGNMLNHHKEDIVIGFVKEARLAAINRSSIVLLSIDSSNNKIDYRFQGDSVPRREISMSSGSGFKEDSIMSFSSMGDMRVLQGGSSVNVYAKDRPDLNFKVTASGQIVIEGNAPVKL